MANRTVVDTFAYALGAAAILCAGALAPAQAGDRASAVDTKQNNATRPIVEPVATDPAFNLDADNDGVIDIVKTLKVVTSAEFAVAQTSSGVDPAPKFKPAFHKPSRHRTMHSACTEYMMLSPEKRIEADMKIQSRTLGMFGSHPCDPVISPSIDRPFDDEYIELPILPLGAVTLLTAPRIHLTEQQR